MEHQRNDRSRRCGSKNLRQRWSLVQKDNRLARTVAAASWLALAILSLLPGDLRSHGAASGELEHVSAYALSALVTRLAFRRTASRLQLLSFVVAAGSFELMQTFVPGRSPTLTHWLSSVAGAGLGVAVGRFAAHRIGSGNRSVSASSCAKDGWD